MANNQHGVNGHFIMFKQKRCVEVGNRTYFGAIHGIRPHGRDAALHNKDNELPVIVWDLLTFWHPDLI